MCSSNLLLLARARRGERASEAAEQARAEALARAEDVERELEVAILRATESDRARQRALERATQAERERHSALEQAERAEWARQRVEAALREERRPESAPASQDAAEAAADEEPVFEEVLDDLEARESERGLTLTLRSELLPGGSEGPDGQPPAELTLGPAAQRLLRPVAGFLREHAHWQVRVVGLGADADLARARAQAVARFLEGEGLRGARLSVSADDSATSVATPDVAAAPPGESVEIALLDPTVRPLDVEGDAR